MNNKPMGIILLTIYTGISGVLSVISGFLLSFGGRISGSYPIIGFLLILLSCFEFSAVYGLWRLVFWGYSLAFILYIIAIPLGAVVLVFDLTVGNAILQLIGIAVNVWILMYLRKPEVKALFLAS
jgi:hypothetical protein